MLHKKVVLSHMSKWAMILKRAAGAPAIDGEFVTVFAEVLDTVKVTAEELDLASKLILAKEEWFPAPKAVIDYVTQARSKRQEAEVKARFAQLRPCVDENGVPWIASPERILDGKLLPQGQTHGNGKSLPSVVQALPSTEGGLKYLAAVTGDERAVAELERLKAERTARQEAEEATNRAKWERAAEARNARRCDADAST